MKTNVEAKEDEDDELFKKIDQVINSSSSEDPKEPPAKKICSEETRKDEIKQSNISSKEDEILAEVNESLKHDSILENKLSEDDLLKSTEDELLKTTEDELLQETEDDLLKSFNDEDETPESAKVENEIDELINSVIPKDAVAAKDEKPAEGENEKQKLNGTQNTETEDAEKVDDLLEPCESPKEDGLEEIQANEDSSNGYESNQNEDEVSEQSSSERTDQKEEAADESNHSAEKEEEEKTSPTEVELKEKKPSQEEEVETEENSLKKTEQDEKMDVDEVQTENSVEQKLDDTEQEKALQTTESKSSQDDDSQDSDEHAMMIDEDEVSKQSITEDEKSSNGDEKSSNEDVKMKEEIEIKEEEIETKLKEETKEITESDPSTIKTELSSEDTTETKPFEPVKFNFIKRFAKLQGKLTPYELEEILLQKTTESLIYRSKCTELRSLCDKQEETIERLNNRVAAIVKQYNDLEMIQKNLMKQLAERKDQPIQPVKITRAVGLQVYQPPVNNGKSKNSSPAPPQPQQSSAPGISKNNPNKRPNENDGKVNGNDSDGAKRKKSAKIITPMRPPLSEREKLTLEVQEATIEQKLRTKLVKNDSTVSNGVANKL